MQEYSSGHDEWESRRADESPPSPLPMSDFGDDDDDDDHHAAEAQRASPLWLEQEEGSEVSYLSGKKQAARSQAAEYFSKTVLYNSL